jgi:transposase-like protein
MTYVKREKVKYKLFRFICKECGVNFWRKVYVRIRKIVKLCDNCNEGKSWFKNHPHYQRDYSREYRKL